MNKYLSTFLIVFILLSVLLIHFFGFDFITGKKLLFTYDQGLSDVWHLNYPLKHLLQEELRAGRLPFWTDKIGLGFPALAESQISALNPIYLILFYFLPLNLAYNLSITINLILLGAFTAILAIELGLSLYAAIYSSIIITFSGFVITHLGQLNVVSAITWMPIQLFFTLRLIKKFNSSNFVLLALTTALSFLACHPQIAYYNILILLLAAIVQAFVNFIKLKFSLKNIFSVICSIIFGLLLAAPQLIPTYELSQLSSRKASNQQDLTSQYTMEPKYLLHFFNPFIFGKPASLSDQSNKIMLDGEEKSAQLIQGFSGNIPYWESVAYLGIIPLILTLLAFKFKTTYLPLLAIISVFSIGLSVGNNLGLSEFFTNSLPFYNSFRFTSRFLFYAALALSLLAAMGLNQLFKKLKHSIGVVTVITLIFLNYYDLYYHFGNYIPKVKSNLLEVAPESVKKINQKTQENLTASFYDHEIYMNSYWLSKQKNYESFMPAWNLLGANLNLLFGIKSINSYSQIPPIWSKDLEMLVKNPSYTNKLLNLMGVNYILSPYGEAFNFFPGTNQENGLIRTINSYDLVESFPGNNLLELVQVGSNPALVKSLEYKIGLFLNQNAQSKLFLVSEVINSKNVLNKILSADFNPSKNIVMEDLPLNFPAKVSSFDNNYKIKNLNNNNYQITSTSDGWLFINSTYYPGWRAFIDNKETKIFKANHYGKAIFVPAGNHTINFIFYPHSFYLGLIVALVGVTVLTIFVLKNLHN